MTDWSLVWASLSKVRITDLPAIREGNNVDTVFCGVAWHHAGDWICNELLPMWPVCSFKFLTDVVDRGQQF